jgi:hypothetical protein
MPERAQGPRGGFAGIAGTSLPAPVPQRPDCIDETVVHDQSGRPWLVSTTDMLYGLDAAGQAFLDDTAELAGRYETQVYYTARAGIRGFPTGHGERHLTREAAVSGHRLWCLRVRTGEVVPDLAPDDPL